MSGSSENSDRNRTGKRNDPRARSAALKVLSTVIGKRRSLTTAKALLEDKVEARERAFAMELVNGVLRWRFRLEALLARLLNKPLRRKDLDVQLILLIALYELLELSTPDYAVVNEAVAQTRRLRKQWAAAMVNAVLRSFIRERQALLSTVDQDPVARYSHPRWLIDRFETDWPDAVGRIANANNGRPPMWLRVNRSRLSTDDYQQQLDARDMEASRHPFAAAALKLVSPIEVSRLPGFDEGLVSVQDASAQLAAQLLDLEDSVRVLDVCAAPGGKTCHILEAASDIAMTAVELEASRMSMVQQNLDRLGLRASLIVGDASSADDWWDGQCFDRILVDAPCSATGVIRRHPDIKSLRQPDDLKALAELQHRILAQAWRLLKPGGLLLYVTCSILRQENEQQIARLLAEQADANEVAIDHGWGVACRHGRQLLPGDMDGDGFYYAKLKKRGDASGDTAIAC